jgi:hypothetical protein
MPKKKQTKNKIVYGKLDKLDPNEFDLKHCKVNVTLVMPAIPLRFYQAKAKTLGVDYRELIIQVLTKQAK